MLRDAMSRGSASAWDDIAAGFGEVADGLTSAAWMLAAALSSGLMLMLLIHYRVVPGLFDHLP
jgi:hypothetical protein